MYSAGLACIAPVVGPATKPPEVGPWNIRCFYLLQGDSKGGETHFLLEHNSAVCSNFQNYFGKYADVHSGCLALLDMRKPPDQNCEEVT